MMDHRTIHREARKISTSANQSADPQYICNTTTIQTVLTTTRDTGASRGESSTQSTTTQPYRPGTQGDVHASMGTSVSENSSVHLLHLATEHGAQVAAKPQEFGKSKQIDPSTSAPGPPPLDRSSKSRRTKKRVDIIAVDPPDTTPDTRPGYVAGNTLVRDGSEWNVVGEDRWRQYRGIAPRLKANQSTTPASSKPRTTFRGTEIVYTRPFARPRQATTQRVDISRYGDAHHGLAKLEIVERAQKNQCTACGELPGGDGKPNHRWFDCPGLPPMPLRPIPADYILPHQRRITNQKLARERTGPGMNDNMGTILVPEMGPVYTLSNLLNTPASSSVDSRDYGPYNHIHRIDPSPDTKTMHGVTDGLESNGAARMVRAPGQENERQIQTPRFHSGISNATETRRLCGFCGVHGHGRPNCPQPLVPFSTLTSLPNTTGGHLTPIKVQDPRSQDVSFPGKGPRHRRRRAPAPGLPTIPVATHSTHSAESNYSGHGCLPVNRERDSEKGQTRCMADGQLVATVHQFQQQMMRDGTMSVAVVDDPGTQPRPPEAFVLPSLPQDHRIVHGGQLTTVADPSISKQTGPAMQMEYPPVRLPEDASRIAAQRPLELNGTCTRLAGDGSPLLIDSIATQHGLRQNPPSRHDDSTPGQAKTSPISTATRGTVFNFLAWFENHRECTARTAGDGRKVAISNAQKVIYREAIDLHKMKGMSRRGWKRLGVHAGIGAEMSRNVDKYLRQQNEVL